MGVSGTNEAKLEPSHSLNPYLTVTANHDTAITMHPISGIHVSIPLPVEHCNTARAHSRRWGGGLRGGGLDLAKVECLTVR